MHKEWASVSQSSEKNKRLNLFVLGLLGVDLFWALSLSCPAVPHVSPISVQCYMCRTKSYLFRTSDGRENSSGNSRCVCTSRRPSGPAPSPSQWAAVSIRFYHDHLSSTEYSFIECRAPQPFLCQYNLHCCAATSLFPMTKQGPSPSKTCLPPSSITWVLDWRNSPAGPQGRDPQFTSCVCHDISAASLQGREAAKAPTRIIRVLDSTINILFQLAYNTYNGPWDDVMNPLIFMDLQDILNPLIAFLTNQKASCWSMLFGSPFRGRRTADPCLHPFLTCFTKL